MNKNSNDNFVEIITCKSAKEYLTQLNSFGIDCDKALIFRGHPNSEHKLIPTIYRPVHDYKNKFKTLEDKIISTVPSLRSAINNRVRNITSNHKGGKIFKNRLEYVLQAAFVETYLVEQFLLEANQIPLYVPTLKLWDNQHTDRSSVKYIYDHIDDYIQKFYFGDIYNISLYEKHTPFINNLVPFKQFIKFDFVEALALARHHGIPLRYLDWTRNPYVAAFFSAFKPNGKDICVWCLNTKVLGPYAMRGNIQFHTKLNNTGLEFLHRQSGLFTEMIGAEGYYFHHGKWPSLDTYLNAHFNEFAGFQGAKMIQIIISRDQATEIIKLLHRFDINQCRLMPTYDNVADMVTQPFTRGRRANI